MNISSKKWVTALIIVLIVIIAAIFIGKYIGTKRSAQETQKNTLQVVRTSFTEAQVPDLIPVDLPQEAGAKVTQNYGAKTTDGRSQGTREYETKKTLADNYALYQAYFKDHGWKVLSTLNLDTVKSITATKDSVRLQVNIAQNSVTNVSTVMITAIPESNAK